ncbi:hypothetical protein LEM8419_03557 [Neolewinella maritima]|uniref:Cytochrome c domain-containing protein n=1 Tax=Neolewinella maritima TaxID=1383882 RepID=A0ABN8FFA0_9BACT|nr:hypothetical protein [Neolewinella maritima]CAH1002685.1 hypothetical protein LEM8419_03557 [Neolewinella maritima]
MTLTQLIRDKTFLRTDPVTPYREAVRTQAMRHTQRRVAGEVVDLIRQRRPHESEEIKQYRADNERQITRAGVEQFSSKVSRIISNGLTINGRSEELQEYLDGKPFYDTGNYYDLEGYLYDVLLPMAWEDPNLLAVAFPYNPLRPEIAPNNAVVDGGLAEDERLGIIPRVVRPTYCDDDLFVFEGGEREIMVGEQKTYETYYFCADATFWYTLEPSWRIKDEAGGRELVYTAKVWYRWDLGKSPVNYLPGQSKTTDKGKYRESFLLPYYTLADEVIGAFSDNQAVRVRFHHPIVSIAEAPCYNASCNHGHVKVDGKKTTCGVCHGTNKVLLPSPYGTIVKPKKQGMEDKSAGQSALDYHSPDIGILQLSETTWRTLLKEARQTIGLDLLDGTGVESGRAKDLRLEDLHDLLTKIGMSVGVCAVQLCEQLEALRQRDPGQRSEMTAHQPPSYRILEASELKEYAEEALFEDRYAARMAYYEHKYRGQQQRISLYELALSIAPAILLNEEEIQNRLAAGSLTREDILRRDYSIAVLERLLREKVNMEKLGEEEARKAVTDYLNNMGLLTSAVPLPAANAA